VTTSPRALTTFEAPPGRAGAPNAAADDRADTRSILVIAPDGTIEACSPDFLRLLGFPNGGLTGTAFLSLLVPGSEPPAFLKGVRDELSESARSRGELTVCRPGGTERIGLFYQASALCESRPEGRRSRKQSPRVALLVEPRRGDNAQEEEARGFSRFSEDSPFPVLRISLKWLSISAVRDEAGKISRYIGLFSDISIMKQTQEQLYEMAHYDSLTGLPNRRCFLDRLKESLDQARRAGEGVALLFVDLDGFKLVNDNLGHRAGDQLLREVGLRIRQCIRESDIAARMGGDEFTVILSQIRSSDSALIVARKILARLYEPVRIDEKELFISSSIGIAVFPDDASEVEGLLQSADTALYKAKDLGKNGYQFFSPEMNRRAMERLTLQTQIRQGLAAHEFTVYYQPQVDAGSGRLVGLEALARWKSPQIGLVSPEQFIPLAEQTGLIHEVGQLVLREACAQGRRWMDQGMSPVRMGVNISAHQLRRPDFVDVIQGAVQESGFPARFLELELTESMLIDDSPQDLDKLSRIKAMGIRLSIDDFGTKYSSFAYLRRLPIDRLKIDRTFVQDLTSDARVAEIVSAIIAMSRSLNLEVIAEGVETAAQADLLKKKGCQTIQGYYSGHPLPSRDVAGFLEHEGKGKRA
jgi:diguanylate cyclase (GGDEF)-like protein